MNNLFNAQVCFNGGNPNLFKVRNDVTLKEPKDQLNVRKTQEGVGFCGFFFCVLINWSESKVY